MNPIVFGDYVNNSGFTPFTSKLDEFEWKDQLVGLTEDGLLYVDEKVSCGTYYTYYPKLLLWKDITEVQITSCLGIKGLFLGLVAIAFGIGISSSPNASPYYIYGVVCSLLLIIAGLVTILGIRRNRVRVLSNGKWFQWMSRPLEYKKTIPTCEGLVALCLRNKVLFSTHIKSNWPGTDPK